MDLSEKYIYAVYKERSFSKAAQKLFISQSALSIMVKKTERKLGFQIFDRSKTPISLSIEGRIYIDYLEETIANENTMHARIRSISNPVYEQVSVGNAYFVSRYLLPKACKVFHDTYPNIELKLSMGEAISYSNLFEKLDAGSVDFLIGFDFDERRYTGIPLLKERYVICIKNNYPGVENLKKYALTYEEVISGEDFSHKRISDYSLFSNIEFLKINSASILWRDMAKLLMHCPISPCQIYDCRNIDATYDMMMQGMGAAIVTDSIVSYHPQTEDVLYFFIETPTPTRQSYAIYKNDVPLSKSASAFIEILQEICA